MADEGEGKTCCRCGLEYSSIACSRTPSSLSWARNGLVAYGGCNCVVLYRPQCTNSAGKVEKVLSGHKDRVNCVKWIPNGLELEKEVVSGSTDKTVIVWRCKENKWCIFGVLEGHDSAVNSVASVTINHPDRSQQTIIASASADSTVKIWNRTDDQGEFQCIQTLSFGYGFAVTIDLSLCPETNVPILACGNEDSKIYIFVQKDGEFVRVQTLVGHEDWIRGLEFALEDSGDLLLASSSKDYFIRIWRITSSKKMQTKRAQETKTPVAAPDLVQDLGELKLTSNLFTVLFDGKEFEFSVVLESVLSGHEDVVYSVHWQPSVKNDGSSSTQPLCLLSASFDKTLIIWRPDEESGVWLEMVRVGGVGGTTLGFYGGVFSPDGNSILGHSYQGAFHLWSNVATSQEEGKWMPQVTVSGHFGPVQDIIWDPEDGQFLMSVSSDQTTRLHAPWHREGKETTWHEIARPQVHGYDMQCLTLINRHTLASGADEKVVRIFKAPRQFLKSLESLCAIKRTDHQLPDDLPIGASVPALGLSNKAVFEGDLDSLKNEVEDPGQPLRASAFTNEEPLPFSPVISNVPPTEDVLLQNTLWPESHKLYGHGFEIFCVASNPDGSFLASACKASKPEHACTILWDTKTWRQVCSLSGHSLTVTQMAFSHSGTRLVTVSRDRSWAMFKRKVDQENGPLFSLASHSSSLKKNDQHSRIIWSCSWSHDDKYFTTASRDKKVFMWGCHGDTINDKENWSPASSPLDVGEPATAVDMAPITVKNSRYLIAVGTESGRISLHTWSSSERWTTITHLDQSLCPVLTVKRIRWRPRKDVDQDVPLYLGSCGSDHSVRVVEISGLV
ncbi:elongator complex protein 2-like [Actinia tenebrosa]|uniref:Elongator complex protein 2 n=1 Tax=Actinia tenebrosa TaxID=6105 RepID=A0A6P8I0G2_ACTTE|nr:elongator complex protein 2-like [Actinia tenebrosa]